MYRKHLTSKVGRWNKQTGIEAAGLFLDNICAEPVKAGTVVAVALATSAQRGSQTKREKRRTTADDRCRCTYLQTHSYLDQPTQPPTFF